ncbi:MAG: ABC transporter substrate-binding protein [Spirochaetota bacterium]|nr:ABC transporter substrate-binding protein [Spirochaetota bacterium]
MYRKLITVLLIGLIISPAFLFAAGNKEGSNEVVIYTALEEDETADYLILAEKELPELDIKWVRYSTGELAAKIMAEKDNPQADLVWGSAVTVLGGMKSLFEPYKPEGWDAIPAEFKDPNGYWTAFDMYVAAFCVNTDRLEKLGLPIPRSWKDLTKPEYAGEIIMPNPGSSGTGYLQVSSILLWKGITEGSEAGWDFLGELHKNIVEYTNSGSAPAKIASKGEIAIGASFGYRVAKQMDSGYPVEIVFPSEGSGYELEANGLVKNAKNPENAKKFLDWAISENAMKEYSKYKLMVTLPGITSQSEIPLPPEDTVKLFNMDFDWASENKMDVVDKWSTLFQDKTIAD